MSLSLVSCAEAAGADLIASPHAGTASLTADLGTDLVLVAAVAPPAEGADAAPRATSTHAAAELLRTLAHWAGGLDQEIQRSAQLWVEDARRAFTVQLLTTAGQGDTLETVAAAAGQGLARLRSRRTDSGVDGVGHLPCGRPVRVGVVSLS